MRQDARVLLDASCFAACIEVISWRDGDDCIYRSRGAGYGFGDLDTLPNPHTYAAGLAS